MRGQMKEMRSFLLFCSKLKAIRAFGLAAKWRKYRLFFTFEHVLDVSPLLRVKLILPMKNNRKGAQHLCSWLLVANCRLRYSFAKMKNGEENVFKIKALTKYNICTCLYEHTYRILSLEVFFKHICFLSFY